MTYPFGTHICTVEIDPATGEIEVTLGQALYEHARYDEIGNLVTGSMMDYALPRLDSFPLFETNRTETASPLNPLGVKGIGEAATIGSTPCVVSAVMDALSQYGVRHIDMPLTAEKVWQAIQDNS